MTRAAAAADVMGRRKCLTAPPLSCRPVTSAPFVSGSGFVRRCALLPSLALPRFSTLLSSSLLLTSSTAFHDWVAPSLAHSLGRYLPDFLLSGNDAAAPMVKVKVGDGYGNWEMALFKWRSLHPTFSAPWPVMNGTNEQHRRKPHSCSASGTAGEHYTLPNLVSY